MENQIQFFTIQDVWDEQDKQIPIDCTKIYDPLHFWEDYGEKYFNLFSSRDARIRLDIQRNVGWLIHKVNLLKIDSVLDAGCGFNRIAPFLLDSNSAKEITGIDISPKQLAQTELYLAEYPKKDKIKTLVASAKHLPFLDDSFDLVISSECLQHIHLPSVQYAIRELRRVSKKYVILIERFVYDGEHPQPHIWSHNYMKLAGDAGYKVLESKLIGNGILGVILKK